jgi:hypothetical protein
VVGGRRPGPDLGPHLVTDEHGPDPRRHGPARPDQDPPQGRRPALLHGHAPPGRHPRPQPRRRHRPAQGHPPEAPKRNHDRTEDADSHYFRKLFAKVRAEAAKACPSVASLTFADTRDTGWSLGRQAGLSDDQTASRSLQSRRNIKDLGDKHYGEIGPEIADQARDLLDPYIEAELKKWKVAL